MASLRSLPAYKALQSTAPDAYSSIEADYEEIALSAKEFGEVERVDAELLADTSIPLDRRMNAALFIYFSRVIHRKPDSAEIALNVLEKTEIDAPVDFYINWV